jgi:uncharacterized spore protein YtfJ
VVNVPDIFRNVVDRLQTSAGVKTVFGDPVSAEGKTIIPVARVRYGFGAGGGSASRPGTEPGNDDQQEDVGGGGGGGVEVTPVGFIEITPGETRYISFEERRRIVRTLVIGVLVALFLLRWPRRRHG